jgi:hypothetical protein
MDIGATEDEGKNVYRPILRRTDLAGESGFALVLAMGVIMVLSIATIAVVEYAVTNSQSATGSSAGVSAGAMAEAGINEAYSLLSDPNNNASDPNLLAGNRTSSFANGASVTWSGSYDAAHTTWTITSTGTVPHPTGGGANVSRSMVATVLVHSGSGTPNAAAWNFLMSRGTSNATTCDMTLSNSTNLQAPLYVEGNLCLTSSSKISQGVDPVNVTVLGKLSLEGSGGVGTSSTRITEADIGGGCNTNILNASHACTTADNVWATTLNNTATGVPIPVADYASAYAIASPGPNHPCTTTSGSPPVWDNDGSLNLTTYPNGSEYPVASPFDLTPASSYTCEVKDGSGTITGQLDWNATTKTLTVKGSTYIDGSVTVGNGATNLVSGSGTLYLSGVFTVPGSAKLCSVIASNKCDFTNWNPNNGMLMIVANGDDGSGNSFSIPSSGWFEGAVYTTKACNLSSSTQFMGPIIGNPVTLGSSTQVKPLPPVTAVPITAPVAPNTHATADSLVYTKG